MPLEGREVSALHEAMLSRHKDDLVVGECKDGPTWTASHLRLDYWVLRRSWRNPAMIGYEVKSGRADWLRDDKWRGYLPLCNELWFVVEKKDAIQEGELPPEVGLLRLAGARLVTVRRAVWREITFPESLATYVLMCRTRIVNDVRTPERNRTDEWRAWLEEGNEARLVGRAASKKIRRVLDERVVAVEQENARLRTENERLSALKTVLDERGVAWNGWGKPELVADELVAPKWAREQVSAAHRALGWLLNGSQEAT
jgi:hypothetical protein